MSTGPGHTLVRTLLLVVGLGAGTQIVAAWIAGLLAASSWFAGVCGVVVVPLMLWLAWVAGRRWENGARTLGFCALALGAAGILVGATMALRPVWSHMWTIDAAGPLTLVSNLAATSICVAALMMFVVAAIVIWSPADDT